MTAKFEMSPTRDGKIMFNLQADNGQVLLTSLTYESRGNAIQGIGSIRTNAVVDSRYARETSEKGEPYFNLKARNGQVTAPTEIYA